MGTEIKIGDQFTKQIGAGKYAECIVVDIVKRISTRTGNNIGEEIFASSDTYGMGQPFQVAKNTVIRDKIKSLSKP